MPGVADNNLAFYRAAGLEPHEDDVLMQLDLQAPVPANDSPGSMVRSEAPAAPLPYPGDPEQVYAWLAPMTF
jgi:hypothetical protein